MSEALIPRGARAAVFATACVVLSVGVRAVAAPGAVPLWSVLIALAAVYGAALSGAGRRRGPAAICGLAVAVQLSLDFWFSLAQADDSIVRNCGLIQALPQMNDSITTCVHHAAQTSSAIHVSPGLLLGQLFIAVICAWPLSIGEAAQHSLWLWLSARGLDLRTAIGVALALPHRAGQRPSVWTDPAEPPEPPKLLVRFEVVRRGPPLGAALG
jgi:hypothetical protein